MLAIEFGGDTLSKYIKSLPECERLAWWQGIYVFLTALLFVTSVVLFRRGIRILESRQSPTPETPVFTRTQVRRGWRAKLDGWSLVFFAAITLVGPLIFWFFFGSALFEPADCGIRRYLSIAA